MAGAMKSKRREWMLRLGLLAASLLVGYLIIEGGLRLLFFQSLRWPGAHYQPLMIEPDPEVGWILQPSQVAYRESLDFRVVLEVNAEGMRNQEVTLDKEPGVFRIAVLGDSYMEASHVDYDDAFPMALEAKLRAQGYPVEVLNFGVAAYGNLQAKLRLERDALEYDPDLILYGFYSENDLIENHEALTLRLWGPDDWRTFARPYAELDADGELVVIPPNYEQARAVFEEYLTMTRPFIMRLPFLDTSVTRQTVRQVRRSLAQRVSKPGHDPNISLGCYLEAYHPPLRRDQDMTEAQYAQYWAEARALKETILAEMQGIAQTHDLPMAVFTVPSKAQVEPAYQERIHELYPELDFDWRMTERALLALADREGFHVLDLVPIFQDEHARTGEMLHYSREDVHWNPTGHRFAAEEVLAWLQAEGLLPPPKE